MSLLKRYTLFFIGIAVQSAGIALVVKGLLGTSPISSVPYVLSLAFPFTFGQTTFFINIFFLIGQIMLLRRQFRRVQLLQAPVTVVFAFLIDVFMELFAWVAPSFYPWKMFTLLLGASFVSLGVALQVIANVLMLSGEGIVYAISQTFNLDFGKVKTAVDCTLVISATLLSLYFLETVEGIREGTLISALITGSIARFFIHRLSYVGKSGELVLGFSQNKIL